MLSQRPPGRKGVSPILAYPALPELDRTLGQALAAHVGTAAACMFAAPRPRNEAQVLHHSLLGTAKPPPPLLRLLPRARFDVGELTATLVTATLAAVLVSKGRLDLSRTLGAVCRHDAALAAGPWRDIPLESLLDHTSGLPDAAPVLAAAVSAWGRRPSKPVLSAQEQARLPRTSSTKISDQQVRGLGGPLSAEATLQLRRTIASAKPTCAPKQQVQPSALNALALGWAIEAVTQQTLDQAFTSHVAEPLQLGQQMHFVRCGPDGPWQPPKPAIGTSSFVATAYCPMRQRLLHGECLDPTCYLLGGVAGHAGLFASVDAIFALLQAQLAALQGRETWLNAGVVARFWSRSKNVADSPFALGWQVPSRHNGMAPGRWSARSVGQVSPAGGCMFVDPAFGLVGVLLVNLADPNDGVLQERWTKLRLRIFDLMASCGQYAVASKRPPGRR